MPARIRSDGSDPSRQKEPSAATPLTPLCGIRGPATASVELGRVTRARIPVPPRLEGVVGRFCNAVRIVAAKLRNAYADEHWGARREQGRRRSSRAELPSPLARSSDVPGRIPVRHPFCRFFGIDPRAFPSPQRFQERWADRRRTAPIAGEQYVDRRALERTRYRSPSTPAFTERNAPNASRSCVTAVWPACLKIADDLHKDGTKSGNAAPPADTQQVPLTLTGASRPDLRRGLGFSNIYGLRLQEPLPPLRTSGLIHRFSDLTDGARLR